MASRIDYILSQLRGEQDPAVAPPMARPYSIAGRTFTPANPLTAVTSGYSWAQSQRDRPRLQKAMTRELDAQERAQAAAAAEEARRWQAEQDVREGGLAVREEGLGLREDEIEANRALAEAQNAATAAYRESQLELSKERLEESKRAKPGGTALKDFSTAKKLRERTLDIDAKFEALSDADKASVDSALAQAMTSALPNAVQRIIEGQTYSDAARNYLADVAFLDNELSRLMSGLAVTGYEMEAKQRWSPYAPGISQAERQIRLRNIQRDLDNQGKQFVELYGADRYSWDFETPKYKGTAGGFTVEEM